MVRVSLKILELAQNHGSKLKAQNLLATAHVDAGKKECLLLTLVLINFLLGKIFGRQNIRDRESSVSHT